MNEWFHQKKIDFYDWLDNASIPAKIGAGIVLLFFVAGLVFAPAIIAVIAASLFVGVCVFSLLVSVLD